MTDDLNEETFRRRLANAARYPKSGLDRRRLRRRAAIWRATAVGSVLAMTIGVAAAVSAISSRPGGPVIVAQPSEETDASEPPQPEVGSASPSPSPSRSPSPGDDSQTQIPGDASPSPATSQTSGASPSEPRPTPSPDPSPSGPAPSPSASQGAPSPTASEEASDHGAPLWGRTFLVVQVTENGQVTHVPPEDAPWTTHFRRRSDSEPSQGHVGWSWGGCNGMGASITVTEDRLTVKFMGGTSGGCEDRTRQERDIWSIEFFESNPQWRLEGHRLWLWSDDAVVELEEDRAD